MILGLVASIAVPQVMKYVGSAKSKTAEIQIERLSTILDLFYLDVGRYPSSEEGLQALVDKPSSIENWNGPYLKEADTLVDPWGRPYTYEIPGQSGDFDLVSLGADGQEGGEGEAADVSLW